MCERQNVCLLCNTVSTIKQGTAATRALGKIGKIFSDVEMIKECVVEAVEFLESHEVDK